MDAPNLPSSGLTPEQLADIENNPPSLRVAERWKGETRVGAQLTREQVEDIENNKDVAAMSYVWILSVVVLYARRDSPFIQHHARQGLWLFLISIPVWIIPRVGQYLEFLVLAGMIVGFLNAAQGKYHDVPIVGKLAKGTLTLRDIWKTCVRAVLHAFGVLKKGVRKP